MALKEIYLTDDVTSQVNDKGQRSGSRVYFAWFDPGDDENFARANCTIGIFSHHPSDFGQMVVNVQVDCLGPSAWEDDGSAAIMWRITVTYGPYSPFASASPLLQLPKVRGGGTRLSKIMANDIDGNPILNTVGDPYDPPIEGDATSLTWYVTRNEPIGDTGFALSNILARSDKVNMYDFEGFVAGTLKTCIIMYPEREYDAVLRRYYVPVEYGFEYKEEGWPVQVLNAGYRYLDKSGSEPKLRQALVDGQPATVPVLLTEEGEQLTPPVDKDNIVINTHKIYKVLDYSVFGLDGILAAQSGPIPPPADGGGGWN